MVALRAKAFGGISPRTDPRLLSDNGGAAISQNYRLTSGTLNPTYKPLVTQTLTVGFLVNTIYRMFNTSGTSYWLAFNSDVDIARSPIAGDTSFRLYMSSPAFEPRVTNLAMATAPGTAVPATSDYPAAWFEPGAAQQGSGSSPNPQSWFVLGVTPPITKPVVTPVGVVSNLVARTYVYTFVTPWGEESAPSTASAVTTGDSTQNWGVTLPDVAPLNTFTTTGATWASGIATYTVANTFGTRVGEYVTVTGVTPSGYNVTGAITAITSTTISLAVTNNPGAYSGAGSINRCSPHNTGGTGFIKRVYRTDASGTGYYLVGDNIAAATTTFTDTPATLIGGQCVTIGWLMPPVDTRGFVLHPSGALVGFHGNEVVITQPLAVYAAPLAYRLTTDYPIVAVKVYGTTIVILTTGNPYVASGTDPSTMSAVKLPQHWPCLSKRGVIAVGDGVMYTTTSGLAKITDAGAMLLTESHVRIAEWAKFNPSTMAAAYYDGMYFGTYTGSPGGTVIFDLNEGVMKTSDQAPSALYEDPQTGSLYMVLLNGNNYAVMQWDADQSGRLASEWKSKTYVVPNPISLGAAKIDADFTQSASDAAAIAAANAAILTANAALLTAITTGNAASPKTGYKALKGSMNSTPMGYSSVSNGRKFPLNGDLMMPYNPASYSSLNFTLFVNETVYYSRKVYDRNMFRLPSGLKYDNFSFDITGNVPVRSVAMAESALELKSV